LRLAEFKMRLLVFFAGALRKWAGSIEPARDEPAQREDRNDDRVAVGPTESRHEAGASGPPEHWTRLVATAPPDHWLDLIRERAPHLLPNHERESVSATTSEVPLDGPLDTSVNDRVDLETSAHQSSNNETAEGPTPKARSRRRTQRTRDAVPPASGAKWLSRLRFRPPKQRPSAATARPPAYPAVKEPDKAAEYGAFLHDSSRPAAGHELPLMLSDRYVQRREPTPEQLPDRNAAATEAARGVRSSGNEADEVADRRRYLETGTAADESGNTRGDAATQERRRQYEYMHEYGVSLTSSKTRPEQAPRETINDLRQPRVSSVDPNIFVERPQTKPSNALLRSAAKSPPETESGKRNARSGEVGELASARDPDFAETREEARFTSRVVRKLNVERPVADANRHASASERKLSLDYETELRNARRITVERSHDEATAMTANARASSQSKSADGLPKKAAINAATREVEHARRRFASVDLTAPALVESSESRWPTLPPSRNFASNFELGDELAAWEREAETLRRLDREQRGILWNA
jgi:hypothetical protein